VLREKIFYYLISNPFCPVFSIALVVMEHSNWEALCGAPGEENDEEKRNIGLTEEELDVLLLKLNSGQLDKEAQSVTVFQPVEPPTEVKDVPKERKEVWDSLSLALTQLVGEPTPPQSTVRNMLFSGVVCEEEAKNDFWFFAERRKKSFLFSPLLCALFSQHHCYLVTLE